MYEKISKMASVYLDEIRDNEDFLTPVCVLDSTDEIENALHIATQSNDYESLINSLREQRKIISNSYYFFIFNNPNRFFVQKCNEFIDHAIEELNNENSFLYRLPDELLFYIFTFLYRPEIEAIKLVCAKFNLLGKASKPRLPFLNLKDPVNTYMKIQKPLSFTPSVVFISKGEIAHSGNSRNITIVNVNTFSVSHVFKGHTHLINKIFFDKKNKRLLSASEDKTIRIWDLEKLKCSEILHFSGAVNSAFSYNNQIIAGVANKKIEVWDLMTRRKTKSIEAHEGDFQANVKDYTDAEFISYSSNILKIWNKKTLDCERSYHFENSIKSIVILPDSSLIIAQEFGLLIRLSKNLNKINEFNIDFTELDMQLHSNGTLLSILNNGWFQERSIDNLELINEWRVFPEFPLCCQISVNDKNGQIVFVNESSIVRSKFSISTTTFENKNQGIILKLKENLNLIFSEFFNCNTGWQFSSEENFFWIRVNKEVFAVLRKELNSSELVNKYEIKGTIASEDKSIIIKINEDLTFIDLTNILVARWKNILISRKNADDEHMMAIYRRFSQL